MDEVRLWKIHSDVQGAPRVAPVDVVDATATEKLLEDALVNTPEVLMEGLTIIGRQNETEGGPLDLLGVDEDGRLVVFELKRGELTRVAVAQVLDYASCLAAMDPVDLAQKITAMSGRGGTAKIDNFEEWYQQNRGKTVSSIGRPRMILVGLGVDAAAKRMVEFLAESNVDISLITFYGFRENGSTYLARQVEVKAKIALEVGATKTANEKRLQEKLNEFHLEGEYNALAAMLRSSLQDESPGWPNASGYTYYLPERTESGTSTSRAYIGLSVPDHLARTHKVLITIQARAISEIDRAVLEDLAKELGSRLNFKPSGYAEIVLDARRPATEFKGALSKLGGEIIRAWEKRRKGVASDSVH